MPKKYIYVIVVALVALVGSLFLDTSSTVNIAYMADSKYLPYVMTSLHSAVANKNKKTRYQIHLIAKDFKPQDSDKLKQMEQNDVKINIYPAQDLTLDFSHLGRFSSFQVALQKIFIAEYLKNVDKVLYLDADTLVQTDLTEVYQTNIKEDYASAVKDGLMYQYPEHIRELNLKNKEFYFNSGVMLLNLDKIRQDGITTKAVIYFNTHNEIFGDQDILNVVFKGKVKPMSYRYNCNSVFFEETDAEFLSAFWQEPVSKDTKQVYQNASILHFAGHKPWTPWFTHPHLKPLWQKYAKAVEIKYHIVF